MPIPSYGAMPLSKLFLLVRALQSLAMIILIGICANFIQMIVITGASPPQEFVGTLSITCIATLYILLSITYFFSHANLGLLVMTTLDTLLLIAFIVCAVVLGKPMSYLNCYIIGKTSYEVDAANAYAFVADAVRNLNKNGVAHWAGATKSNCFQGKTVWGLSIALCILFTTSCVLLPTLWYKNKKATPAGKSVEDA